VGLRVPAVGSWELRAPVSKSGCVSRDNANRGGSELLEEKMPAEPFAILFANAGRTTSNLKLRADPSENLNIPAIRGFNKDFGCNSIIINNI